MTETTEDSLWTLKITGLGHNLTLDVAPTSTVGDLKAQIEQATKLPPYYQRLLSRGAKLDEEEHQQLTLPEAGLKDRTKIMLLHSPLYAKEKQGFEQLQEIQTETEELAAKMKTNPIDPKVITELVTRICCKLDLVDTAGSDTLRQQRKTLLQQAEALDQHHHQQQQESHHDDDHQTDGENDKKY